MQRTMVASFTLALLGTAACGGIVTVAMAAPDLTIFGDSYSRVPRGNFPNWVTQLQKKGKVGDTDNFAISGALAASAGSKTFAKEISHWKSAGRPVNDYTVVYLGYNDIDSFRDSFSKSRSGYTSGVKALDAAGAKLVLVQPHDIGTAPRYSGKEAAEITANTQTWNKFVRGTASTYHAITVDLFKALGKVSKSSYVDDFHLGEKGQGMIASAIGAKLGGSSRVASSMRLGTRNVSRAQADSEAGLSFALAAGPQDAQLGLTAFPIGDASLLQAGEAGDPSRAQFTSAFAPEAGDGGAGFTYALGQGTTLGVTIASYDDADQTHLEFGTAGDRVRSDLVGLTLDQDAGAFTFRTRLGYSNDTHETRRFDDLTRSHNRASFGGSTLDLAQRVGLDMKRKGYTLTPWAELAYQRQTTDSFTISNPYLAEQTYDTAPVSDTLGRVGLDLAMAPVQLGEAGWLTLFGGLSYTHGLMQDDYRVSNSEAGLAGSRDESIDRPATRTMGFDLGASLDLGQQLALDAGLSLQHDLNTGTDEAARVALSYRF